MMKSCGRKEMRKKKRRRTFFESPVFANSKDTSPNDIAWMAAEMVTYPFSSMLNHKREG